MYHTELINVYCGRRALFPRPDGARRPHAHAGFTLLELAIVLIIIGLLLGVGIGSWWSMAEGRRIAKTVSDMAKIKKCLVKRSYFSERYPTYSANLDCSASYSESKDVDKCLCGTGQKDAWDGDLYYLEGLSAIGVGLQDKALVSNPAQGIGARVKPDSTSEVTDHKGNTRGDVAFVLISYGPDGVADSTTYGNRFLASQANFLNGATDFETGHTDDIYLVVTSRELMAALKL